MDPSQSDRAKLLELNQMLLDAISRNDWQTYERLCDPSLTCFEPETRGQLVEGLGFHRFYFDHGGHLGGHRDTVCDPRVRFVGGEGALVCYTRLVQFVDDDGIAHTIRFEETRVWERREGEWKHVHFHRSASD